MAHRATAGNHGFVITFNPCDLGWRAQGVFNYAGPICEKLLCGAAMPHYYELFGVFCYLCPPCRTDLQEFIYSEVSLHDYWVGIANRNQHMADPLTMGAIIDENSEREIQAFHQVREWLRTPKRSPKP